MTNKHFKNLSGPLLQQQGKRIPNILLANINRFTPLTILQIAMTCSSIWLPNRRNNFNVLVLIAKLAPIAKNHLS